MDQVLYLINDYSTNGYIVGILDLFYIISLICSIYIIISKNPVVSVLFLIVLFSIISAYLMLIGIYFIGISYILVYVGAVSILFLFILMLINIRISELLNETNNTIPLAILTIIIFDHIIGQVLPYNRVEFSFIDSMYNSFFEFYSKIQGKEFYSLLDYKQQIAFASAKN
jgi:NADH-ubiquinone oxidoreductase chain 6